MIDAIGVEVVGSPSEGDPEQIAQMNLSSASGSSANGQPFASFRIRVTNDLADLGDIWPRSDSCASAHCYAFQCAEILQVWCDTVGRARGSQIFFVAIFDDAERPLLLLPLCIERQEGIRILRFVDAGLCDFNAPVIFEPLRIWEGDVLRRMWRELVLALPRFDIAILEKMPSNIGGSPNPLIGLGTPSSPSGHFLEIAGSWEEFKQRLPYKRESTIQRRRLAKLGQVTFKIAETPADRERVLEAMMRQKSRRQIETTGVDGLDQPGYRKYFSEITRRFTWPGPVLVAALEVNGEIIATNWGLIFNKRFLGLVMAYEGGDWRRYSPGRLLLEDLLKWNLENGITIYDFGFGDEEYKLAYCDQTLPLYRADLPVSLVGSIYQNRHDGMAWRRLWGVTRRVSAKLAGIMPGQSKSA